MSKFKDFVIGMNEAAGLSPAGVVLLYQFGKDEKSKIINSVKSQVENSFKGLSSVFGAKSNNNTVSNDATQTVISSRRAIKIRGTQENILTEQTGLLRSLAKNSTMMNNWLASIYDTNKGESTTTNPKSTTQRLPPPRDAKTGKFIARPAERGVFERLKESVMKPINSIKSSIQKINSTTSKIDEQSPVESVKKFGLMSRMSTFMSDIRQTFDSLPGVGAATSLLVMKVAKEQTTELIKIRKLLDKSYQLDEKNSDASEENDFEKKDPLGSTLAEKTGIKKEKSGGWLGNLIPTIFGELVEGMMIRYGLKGLTGKIFSAVPSFSKITGIMKNIPGVGKIMSVFGEMGQVFTKIPGLGNLAKLAKGGIGKLALPLTAILAIFDFFSGWKDAGKILDKAEDAVTLADQFSTGIGGVLGGLVGVLDAILGLFGVKTDMGGFVKKWTGKLLSSATNFITDSIMTPLKTVGDQIAKIFGFKSFQSATDFIQFKINKGTKFIKESFDQLISGISGYYKELKTKAFEGVAFIGESIGNGLLYIGDSVSRLFGFDSMKSAYESLKLQITGVFNGIGLGVSRMLGFENFDALINKVMELKDMILKPFNFIVDKVGGFVKGLGKVASYLGYNDKEFLEYEKSLNQARATQAQQSRAAKISATSSPATNNAPVKIPTISTPPPKEETAIPIRQGQNAEWVKPLMSGVTSDFGLRNHPVSGQAAKMHEGTDYSGKMGDPVRAAGDGVVQLATSLKGYGNVIYLNHDNGYQTRYAHLSAFAPIGIGQRVTAGQVIGAVGNSGIGTGPHLHFEVRKGWSLANSQSKPENPEIFFRSLQQTQVEDMREKPMTVPVQRPKRDLDLMTRWNLPNVAMNTGVGQMVESAISGVPAMIRRVRATTRTRSRSMDEYRPGHIPPEISDIAVKMESETGVPAAVTIAQWATESGWGQKGIGNNVFGITKSRRHSKSQTKSTTEDITFDQFQKFSPKEQASVRSMDGSQISGPWQGKMKVKMDREFADFDNIEDAFRDHSRLLSSNNGPYKMAFDRYKMTGDVNGFIRDIAPTYATDRNYGNMIGGIANQRNVTSAITASRNALGVNSIAPVSIAQGPTIGKEIMRNTAENAELSRSMNRQTQSNSVTVSPVNVNQSSTSIVADLKARNSENTHKRIMDREHYRT